MSVILAGFGSFWLVVGRFGWFWLVLGRFGSFWLVLGRFGWFRVLVSTPDKSDAKNRAPILFPVGMARERGYGGPGLTIRPDVDGLRLNLR